MILSSVSSICNRWKQKRHRCEKHIFCVYWFTSHTWPMSPTTLPIPSILGLLHSAPDKSVRAAAVWASGSGSPLFIPRTTAGPPAAFAWGPAAVSMSLSRSIIPRLTGSIIDATSVDINIGRETVTSQKSLWLFLFFCYLCLLLLVCPRLDIHNGFGFSQTDNIERIFINIHKLALFIV